jgi:membrane protein DedA with SNARE-associated domain
MLLESSSLPIPSEVILPFAGFQVSLGQLNFWLTVLVSTVAGLIGSFVDYYIGLKGADWLARHKILDRLLFSRERLNTAERWFNKYGGVAVFLSRIIPGFRTLVSFPAGAAKMSLVRFALYTTIGCMIWNVFLVYLGVYLGRNWSQAAGVSRYLIIAAFAALVLTLLVLWIRRRNKRESV